MSESIPRCFTNLIDSLRKSILGSNEIHTLVLECKCDKESGFAITEDESRRWLGLARSKIIDGGLDGAGFHFGIQPRIFLRTWISKHVSGPIAEDVNRCILKLENHREHLWCLTRCVKSGEGLKWEGEKFRRVLYYWRSREFEIIAVLFELLKSIDFAMGWGLDKPSHPFYWQEYEKHPQTETIAADDGEDGDGIPGLALQAVIDGGDAGLINQAIKVPAAERYSVTMMNMLAEDRKYYEWGLADWMIFFQAAKKTIQSTDAWRHIMAYREQEKQNRSKE